MAAAGGVGGRRRTGPSIRDVARLAGVSAQTVSRVSTGAEPVRPETRERVLQAMATIGYSPNRAARALRLGRFGAIGVMAHRYERTGETQITAAVADAAERHGYSVNLISIQSADEEQWRDAAHRISHQAIDALIIIRAETAAPDTLALPPGLPVAVADSRLFGHYPSVTADTQQGTKQAVDHLLSLGHRTVHHLSGPADSEPAQIRRATWQRTLELAGIAAPDAWEGGWSPETGYRIGLDVADDPDISAVYAANDEMALGFMRALHERGRRVPGDVSVVGFDGIALGAYAYPPLTTVRQDFAGIGQRLVDLVVEQIRGRGTGYVAPSRTVLPTELVVRSSTAPPSAGIVG